MSTAGCLRQIKLKYDKVIKDRALLERDQTFPAQQGLSISIILHPQRPGKAELLQDIFVILVCDSNGNIFQRTSWKIFITPVILVMLYKQTPGDTTK
jgi:hypothetical protein